MWSARVEKVLEADLEGECAAIRELTLAKRVDRPSDGSKRAALAELRARRALLEERVLPKLRTLSLSDNQLTGRIPREALCRLGELELLYVVKALPLLLLLLHLLRTHRPPLRYLHDNEFTGPIPNLSALASSLRFLNLERNELKGRIPISLANLTRLSLLLVGGNEVRAPRRRRRRSRPSLTSAHLTPPPSLLPRTKNSCCPGTPPASASRKSGPLST